MKAFCTSYSGFKKDLDAHENLEHTKFVDDGSKSFHCNFCKHCFTNKSQLMKHKKLKHTERVSTCWNFQLGKCSYGDESCWFLHAEITGEILNAIFVMKSYLTT